MPEAPQPNPDAVAADLFRALLAYTVEHGTDEECEALDGILRLVGEDAFRASLAPTTRGHDT